MAERRMFAKTIIDSDAFLDMPLSAQALYFHLSMRADDDGFINNPKKIQRMIGAADDDLKLLLLKRFVIGFESGVLVIKHWKIHNYIQKDRYKPTIYKEEMAQLSTKENRAYTERVTECIQDGYTMETQVRLGKDRLELVEDSVVEESIQADKPPVPPAPDKSKSVVRNKYGQYGWVRLSDEEYHRLINDFGEAEVQRCITYVDESAQGNGNKNKWKDWNLVVRRCHREGWGLNKGGYGKKPHMLTKEENDARRNGADWMMKYVTRPEPKTAGDDPDIRERAEKLQRELKGE